VATLNDIRNSIQSRPGYLGHIEYIDPINETDVLVTFEIYQATRRGTRFVIDYLVVYVKNYGTENETALLSENININYVLTPGRRHPVKEKPEERGRGVTWIPA